MHRGTVRVLAFVLAGGEGKRLAPLTRQVAKPAVPFHGRHRLIDFALSNLRNSGVQAIHVLAQYGADSVLEHLADTWGGGGSSYQGFVNPIVGGRHGLETFRGTADAVWCNRQQIVDFCPDVVAVFGADHVYRMDVRQMVDEHLATGADATVAALPVPLAAARGFGVIATDAESRIRAFAEKPREPAPMPGRPDCAFASMGNYLFRPATLLAALDEIRAAGQDDFGGHLLPHLLARSARLQAYDFATNRVPGGSGVESHYWRDVGTLDAYFAAQMDTLGDAPRFDLGSAQWPIRCSADAHRRGAAAAATIDWPQRVYGAFAASGDRAGRGAGTSPGTPRLTETILRTGVTIGERSELSRCVVFDDVSIGAGCRLRNVIIDRHNAVPDGTEIGIDDAADRARFQVSDGGVVVVPSGTFTQTAPARRGHGARWGRRPAGPATPSGGLLLPA